MRSGPASLMGNRYAERSATKRNIVGILLNYMEQICPHICQQETF